VLAQTMSFSALCLVDVGEALGLYNNIQWIHDLQLANVNF